MVRHPSLRLMGSSIAVLLLATGCAAPSRDARPDSATPVAARDTASAWSVRGDGAGPLRIGMSFADAAKAAGMPLPDTSRLERTCDYLSVGKVPPSVALMWVEGHLARIDVRGEDVATVEGIHVGASELEVRAKYTGRLSEEPHKYVERGKYLVVAPAVATNDSLRLVFETDGANVTGYRVGRLPEVRFVEGCA